MRSINGFQCRQIIGFANRYNVVGQSDPAESVEHFYNRISPPAVNYRRIYVHVRSLNYAADREEYIFFNLSLLLRNPFL